MPKSKQPYGITSQEAAALYLSDGQTDDPGLASMMDYAKKQPELLVPKGYVGERTYEPPKLVIEDPDAVERTALRNAIGFDYEVTITGNKVTVTNTETSRKTKCVLTGDETVDAASITNAVMRLKRIHDKRQQLIDILPEGQLV